MTLLQVACLKKDSFGHHSESFAVLYSRVQIITSLQRPDIQESALMGKEGKRHRSVLCGFLNARTFLQNQYVTNN